LQKLKRLSQTARLGTQLFLFSLCEHLFSQIAASNTREKQALIKSYEKRMNDAVMNAASALGLTYEQFKALSGRTIHAIRAESALEPTKSEDMTVTWRRSAERLGSRLLRPPLLHFRQAVLGG
jgi:hypothetical protein